ncbi:MULTISPECIES: DUF421 domain-containing protein [Ruminococcus]|jgi:uncharacterized membrane protein YcaP (DUF421 family)|uniref:DUF421 domain-containing protein n=1 Tax=Ruminococcus difficilis TaxID=2763069 RepID=A0A934U2Q5_9FIRM|nr:DUF421 domain-containing protein [Ruminococcus difficilis]MBQ1585796.1 DUF421 domain-containing protein [Ruminococcus sp.]MBK6087249.1 DUF421 domain-containing protein [Ruminococcus difficilis]MBQ2280616.1 DUF421 domain-containing protein [Ruminococcus sp.]MBQ2427566.1 DUF421 domain-containing protein [Ruminococcus sp.]MBQ2536959.1 DUF421 domain-containing protein [Ruminococcus sp.]
MIISILRTVILYVFIILAIRLMGKRQISDMQPSELVVTLVVSDIASLPMQNTSQPLLSGVIPVLVLVSLEIAASALMMKSRLFRRLICGNPVVVIEDGKLLQKQLKRLRMSAEDLFAQLRQQDIFSIDEVQYCIVETNGSISVLEKPQNRVPTAQDLGVTIDDKKLEAVVVCDGELLDDGLKLCSGSRMQVDNILQENNAKLSEVFILTLDGNGKYNLIAKEVS